MHGILGLASSVPRYYQNELVKMLQISDKLQKYCSGTVQSYFDLNIENENAIFIFLESLKWQ